MLVNSRCWVKPSRTSKKVSGAETHSQGTCSQGPSPGLICSCWRLPVTFPGPSRGRGAQAGGKVNSCTPEEQLCRCPRPCILLCHPPLPSQLRGCPAEGRGLSALGFSHLRQLTHPLSLIFLICKLGTPTESYLRGSPEIPQYLLTRPQITRRTSWNFSAWICPFQLLEWTALLVRQRCSRKVYYLKNTSLGRCHSHLRPV